MTVSASPACGLRRVRRLVVLAASVLGLAGCAGPHGERPVLDSAVTRPGAAPYGFSGGYAGATAGTALMQR